MQLMRLLKYRPSYLLVLNLMMLGLLILLALLQYRWMGQVSQADRERRRAALMETAVRFCSDFDRELTRAYFHFGLDHHEIRELDFAHFKESVSPLYASRYSHWAASAPFPNIINGLFIVQRGLHDTPNLTRFNRVSSCFEDSGWPTDLREICELITRRFKRSAPYAAPGPSLSIPPVIESIPALVIPCAQRPIPRAQSSPSQTFRLQPGRDPLVAIVIVKLDRAYLSEEFLPALAKRHFFHNGHPEYDLVVVNRGLPNDVVYRSASGLSAESMHAVDAKLNFFGLQPDELSGIARDQTMPLGRSARLGHSLWRAAIPTMPNQWGPLSAASGREEFGYGDWEVLLKHRTGSLDAVVASAHRRNLTISFGILVLLGCSLALIMASVRRAQHLAQQQLDFVAGVSHELRTPLAVICSAGENLADGMINDARQFRKYGVLIRDEGRRLTTIVEQVLNFSGTQSGKVVYDLQRLNPIDLVERALEVCKPLLSQGGFQLERHFFPGSLSIVGDAMALGVCLQNLLRNAIQYAGENRWICVQVKAEMEKVPERVMISVADRGMGIDPKDLPHIFNPFYRGSTAVKAQIHGTGLGLSLVKRIVEGHGGQVQVSSKPGHGSLFTLWLPAVVPEPECKASNEGDSAEISMAAGKEDAGLQRERPKNVG
ncbi:MAG TPA: HAMP domain-containing sensor histidine kinase [Terriglobia bacterium]|nr:HAMP domain-containing sensor histidine kinase [Terriglobia bacterium]